MKVPWVKYSFFAIFFLIFLFTRVIFLDRDIPPWEVSEYSAVDEFYYSIAAFNKYRFDDFNYQIVDYLNTENLRLHNLFQNVLTYTTLEIFGNNYYGLRMASVLVSLFSIVLFVLLFNQIFSINKIRFDFYGIAGLTLLVYLIFDYNYLIAGRVSEPTIFRIFALLFVVYFTILAKFRNIMIRALLLGIVSGISVFFVYLNNLFIIPSVFLFLLLKGYPKTDQMLKSGFFFITGIAISLFSYLAIFKYLFHDQPLLSIIGVFMNYQDRVNVVFIDAIFQMFKSMIGNSLKFFSTNIYRHNVILLLAFLASLPLFIQKIMKQKKELDIVLLVFYVFLFFQSLFINDYFFRKQLIQLPIVVLILISSLSYCDEFFNTLPEKFVKKYYWYLLLVGLFSLFIFFYANRIYTFYSSSVVYINLFVGIFVSIGFMILIYVNKEKSYKRFIFFSLLLMFLPNFWLSGKYIFYQPQFKHKEAMINAAPILNDKVIAGGPSHALRLYNTSRPILDYWQYEYNYEQYRSLFFKLLDDGIIDLSLSSVNRNGDVYPFQFMEIKPTDVGFSKIGEFDINLDLLIEEKGIKLGVFKPTKPL